ncbi:hypothetical protein [Antarcticirhabdus aurantiaca]|uniref:Uncharacterized protein n=1 Tax=Antarcticirhabdus aurantiaca TaxID=2606717 RepID=A0ACD4NP45_9HYPH|nr:hypothetical protein [Antarcticirhabdus aurantiaca]WAJ28456.1 hypothetical protein OXU80_27220 [Jeongeuplla avenae]
MAFRAADGAPSVSSIESCSDGTVKIGIEGAGERLADMRDDVVVLHPRDAKFQTRQLQLTRTMAAVADGRHAPDVSSHRATCRVGAD